MKNLLYLFLGLGLMFGCSDDERIVSNEPENENLNFISAVDISRYPEISNSNPIFYDNNGNQNDFLNILKENGKIHWRIQL